DLQLDKELVDAKPASRRQLGNEFATRLPQRLAALWLEHARLDAARPLAECRDADLQRLGRSVHGWQLMPSGDEGWRKAEVM
ncbi:hypothetical protein ACO1NC_14195, partial [Staphylococcus aureus]